MHSSINEEIRIINNIVVQAIIHGGDPGGSYDTNEENLVSVLNDWLECKNLFGKYVVIIDDNVKGCASATPQIKKIGDIDLSWVKLSDLRGKENEINM